MNKTAIKNFAIWARNKLIADIQYRAGLMGIMSEDIKNALPQSTPNMEFYDIGTAEPYSITGEAIRQRQKLVEILRQKEKDSDYSTAYKYILEEVAYTWFNRLIAIRFMEVNDYLPSHIRVLSSESGKVEPDLVTTPFDAELDFTHDEEETILRLKTDNALDELFRRLFIKQCNALNEILPALFEKTNDYTELLLNLSVVDRDGVVYHLIHDIDEDDFNIEKGGQVEIIGWLYQYYNTEPKDEAFALLKKNVKITKERIPAATQLFTPDWIVRYMVENSLGRLWLEGHPNDNLKAGWKYYLDEAEQEAEVEAQLAQIREGYRKINPEDIKVIDPCMGSGHILVYAFDVLMQIYEVAGYTQREAAKSILENNLYGLDIDDRAFQLAYFAVMMKARQYNRRILNGETDCHVYSIQESNTVNRNHLKYLGAGMDELERNNALKQMTDLLDIFVDAKEYGSILNVDVCDWDLLRRFVEQSDEKGQLTMDSFGLEDTKEQLRVLFDVGQTMAQKYDVVVTNPPYMGLSNANPHLNKFAKTHYSAGKADLCTCFMERCIQFCAPNRYMAMINIPAWMSLVSFEDLRKSLISTSAIITMAHFGRGVFGSDFGSVAFVVQKGGTKKYTGCYLRLFNKQGAVDTVEEKEKMFFFNRRFYCTTVSFEKIPGCPIAYWLTRAFLSTFDYPQLGSKVVTREGMATADNDRFLRFWQEVDIDRIGFNISSTEESVESSKRWFPYNKGGEYRKWYGNLSYIVNWENDGWLIRNNIDAKTGRIRSHNYNGDFAFRDGFTWTSLSISRISVRRSDLGFLFDSKGAMGFTTSNDDTLRAIALLNSVVGTEYLKIFSPTVDFKVGDIIQIPLIEGNCDRISDLTGACIKLSKMDWDSFETSWDFQFHPLVRCKSFSPEEVAEDAKYYIQDMNYIREAFTNWNNECYLRFNQLKANEEELNRIFIDIYGLQDELTPEVEDKDVTVRKADLSRDIRSLISYAVGCMFGRYSLDRPGLVFAGGDFDRVYWKHKGQAPLDEQGEPIGGGYAGITLAEYHYPRFHDAANWEDATLLTFEPDKDNILLITDEEYFPDDIVGLFCAWLKKVYVEDTLEDNLDFIAKALGNKGNTSREIIRNYFLNDFFKDHCQTYSVTGSGKRPIYWLFDSGKQNGFKALVYMHRYDENTVGNLRIDYLHRMERVYDSEIARMQDIIDNSKVAREVTQATKRREKLQKQLKECKEYDERIAHLALARIPIDLDDGVKVNYEKIQTVDGVKYPVLAKI